jgi:hyperosmotically inducible periplasmic protein
MRLSNVAKPQVAVILAVLILIGCSAMTGRQSSRGAVDDASITSKVKSSFVADPVVSATDIDVDTSGGVVILSGFVASERERQRAVQLARDTTGVKQVDASNLVLRR